MKVLFLGHYKNDEPEGFLSQHFILSMHSVGIPLLCRHIDTKSNLTNKIHPIILELEQSEKTSYDICIQYLKPEYIVGSQKFKKNIGILNGDDIVNPSQSELIYNYNLLDEIWVFDKLQKEKLVKHITKPIRIVPPPSSDFKQKLIFTYNNPDSNIETFSIENVGKTIKELLSA
jgi:hypothetical protein